MVLIGVIVFLFATIFGFISLGLAWSKCSKKWAICAILCGIFTFIGCFITELRLPAIGIGIILLFFSFIPIKESGDDSQSKNYRDNNKSRRIARVSDDPLNDLYNKKSRLEQEIFRLKREQIKLINQLEQGNNGQSISPAESKNSTRDEVSGVDIHCDFCDEIYSIKERRCPNCKAENPYWENISDFE